MTTIKITNQDKFNKVSDVDLSQSSNSIYRGIIDGNVTVELNTADCIDYTGEHGVRDWEDDFGFIVVEV